MPDIFTAEKRSQIMSRIKASGTVPERQLYDLVRLVLGRRWRIDSNVQNLPGRPDIVIRSLSLVIFMDGCFYHSCPVHGHIPKSNKAYWSPKLGRTTQRDKSNRRRLRSRGYAVWRFWEHDLKPASIDRTHNNLSKRLLRRKAAIREAKTDSASRVLLAVHTVLYSRTATENG